MITICRTGLEGISFSVEFILDKCRRNNNKDYLQEYILTHIEFF
jgi:hypothetical protein